jgi:hypothetical protein
VRAINLPFAAQQDLEDALDEAWCGAVELRNAGLPQPAVPILADSFSGKSSGARNYVKKVMGSLDAGPGTIPVVYAKLDTDGTVGSLAADILRGCRTAFPARSGGIERDRPSAIGVCASSYWTNSNEQVVDRRSVR